MSPHRRRSLWWFAAAALLLLALQWLAVLNPAVVEPDPEEMVNAAHAEALAHGHLRDAFRLQYRPFCGGCTLDALLAAPLFAALPPLWGVWKLVPIGFLLLLLATAARRLPPPAGAILALLLLLPPSWAFLGLSLVAWGNHYEAGVLAAAGLLLLAAPPRRPLAGGLLLGGAVWVGFSGLFALPAAILWLLLRERPALPRFLAGALLGLSPWLLLWWTAGASPFGEIYGDGEALPALAHLPAQLETLLHPRQLAALLGHPWLGLAALPVVGAWLAAGWLARRTPEGQLALLALLCWSGVYLLSGFHIPVPPAPQLPSPASLRYFAPVFPLLLVVMAAAAGRLAPTQRGMLLAGPLLIGLLTRTSVLAPPFPVASAWTMQAPERRLFRAQATYALPRSAHRACRSDSPQERSVHDHALGRLAAEVAFEGNPDPTLALKGFRPPHTASPEAFYGGAALALLDRLGDEAGPEALEQVLAAGAGWPAAARREALRARAEAPWLAEAIEGHDEAALQRLQEALAGRSEAWWWLAGWRWGMDTSRPLLPSEGFALPEIPEGVPAGFAEGLGEALGEQWGGEPRLPQGLPARQAVPFAEGYRRGRQQRWGR